VTEHLAATERVSSDPVRLRDGARFCLVVYLAVRVGLSILAGLGVSAHVPGSGAVQGVLPDDTRASTPGWHNAVDGVNRWDAGWFLRIAADGYRPDDASAAFFPGYPIAVRVIDRVFPGGTEVAGLLVSNAAFIGSLIVLYALTTREFGLSMAPPTVLLLSCFPTAFFYFAPYSESLFLLTSLLAFWWARGTRWWLAAFAGFVAGATRSFGVLLVPALLLEARAQDASVGATPRWERVLGATAPLAGMLTYLVYWQIKIGDPLQPFHAQSSWLRHPTFPVITLGRAAALGLAGIGDPRGIFWTVDLLFALVALAILTLGWRRLPLPYLAYSAVSLLMPLVFAFDARPLLSYPRFVAVVFPLFWIAASWFDHRKALIAVVATSSLGLAVLSLAFMNWQIIF
jgi:Gpi18-like mannosyltransferase